MAKLILKLMKKILSMLEFENVTTDDDEQSKRRKDQYRFDMTDIVSCL